jgi:hypothetical protein
MLAPPINDKTKEPVQRKPERAAGPAGGKAHEKNGVWQSLALRPLTIQAKLTVGQPGDAYEQEADHIADRVMSMPESQLQRTPSCACGGGCPKCQNKQDGQAAHEHLQTKRIEASETGQAVAPAIVHQSLQSSGQAMDPNTRGSMESRFGHDFSGVRVHADGEAAEAARAVQARAFTTGRDIVFGAGEYQPATAEGQRLLAHELTHVAQQNGLGGGTIQRAPAAGPAPSWTVAELTGMLDACDGGLGLRAKARAANNDKDPTIVPGDGGSMDPATGIITLDRTQDKCFAVQQLVQELSNMSRKSSFDALDNSALAGDVSREDYIKRTELIEYETGVKNVLTAFDACKETWSCATTPKEWARGARDFADYYDTLLSTEHKEYYGKWWDEKCRVAYDKKTGHRGEAGAPTSGTPTPDAMEHVAGRLWATDAEGNLLPPALEDISQGGVADCFLFAAMAAIVNTDPQNIVNMIVDNGDDTYTVTFKGIGFFSSAEQKVTSDFPVGKHGSVGSRKAIWPLVIEKAYAQEKGGIDKLGTGGSVGTALDDMLDVGPSSFNPQEETVDYIMGKVAKAKEEKWPMTISAPKKDDASTDKKEMADNTPGLYFWHAYTIIDVDPVKDRIKLFNPWGRNHPNGDGWISAEQARKFFININIHD